MNYGALKQLIQDYLETEETSFVDNLPTMIRAAEEDIFRQVQLPDLMQTATSSCTTDEAILPMPSDFLSPYSLGITVAGETVMLISKDHSFIKETYPSGTGTPRFYAIFNDANIILGPTPDDDYAVELNYFYEPASITDGTDSDTTWLSTNAENALLFGAIVQGYTYLKGDQDVFAQYKAQYDTALAALKILAEGRNRKDIYRVSDRRIAT